MPPNPRLVHRTVAATTFALLSAALLGHAGAARAQSATSAQVAGVEAGVAGVLADVIPATRSVLLALPAVHATTLRAALDGAPTVQNAQYDGQTTQDASQQAAAPAKLPAPTRLDDALAANDIGPVDDQTLSRQRGGAVGMVMVAATPQLMRGGNSVTLWDEIAPPAAPIPIPSDSSQAAQGNVATYTRNNAGK